VKKYRITVNGKTFDVDVEEVGAKKSMPSPVSAPVVVPAPVPAPRAVTAQTPP